MKDIDQEIIKFNYDGNFKEDDFYVSKSNKPVSYTHLTLPTTLVV